MPETDIIFGKLAVKSGFLTIDQLRKGLMTQKKLVKAGKKAPLPAVLKALKLMTVSQIKNVSDRYRKINLSMTEIENQMRDLETFKHPIIKTAMEELKTQTSEETLNDWRDTIGDAADSGQTVKADTKEEKSFPMALPPRRVSVAGRGKSAGSDFELLKLIGRGGMAQVYTAHQTSIRRQIALKLIKPEQEALKKFQATFIAEAIATGNLDHPNIVPVYELGKAQDGKLFYTMKQVVGDSWSQVIKEKSADENIDILMRVCDAVAFSHDKGVIHRDLKPDNIMLGGYGEVLLMDWGIAAAVDEKGKAQRLTSKNILAGTPAYMPPETARADIKYIGYQSDIYLLGGILYQIITGLSPHRGKNPLDCIKKAMQNQIQPTSQRGELIDIARKAMADYPEERYESVKAFQEAVRNYQAHAESIKLTENAQKNLKKAIDIRNYDTFGESLFGFREALRLWPENRKARQGVVDTLMTYGRCAFEKGDYDFALSLLHPENFKRDGASRSDFPDIMELINEITIARTRREGRKRRIKWLSYGSLGLGVCILLILTGAFFWIRDEKERAVQAERAALIAQANAEKENYFNIITLVGQKIKDGLSDQGLSLLLGTRASLRSWEWGFLKQLCQLELQELKGHSGAVEAVSYSPDGRRIASWGRDGEIIVWDARKGKRIQRIETGKEVIRDLDFSEDGSQVMALTEGKRLISWAVDTGKEYPAATPAPASLGMKNISPDGQYEVVDTHDPRVIVKNRQTGTLYRVFNEHSDIVGAVAFSPDGRYLATGGWDAVINLWKIDSRELVKQLKGHHKGVTSLAFSPDGQRLISGSWDTTLKVWNLQSILGLQLAGHTNSVEAVAFSPDGRLLVTGGRDRTLRIWDAVTGQQKKVLNGHTQAVISVAFSPDGKFILSGSHDNTARLWNAATGVETRVLTEHGHSVASVAFSPDNAYMATAGWDHTARIWDAAAGRLLKTLRHPMPVLFVAFTPDGKQVITSAKDNIIRLWQTADGQETFQFKGHEYSVYSAAPTPDGRLLVSGSWDHTIRIWDMAGGRLLKTLEGHAGGVAGVAVSKDGKRIISGGKDRMLKLWDIDTGRELASLEKHKGPINAVAMSSDGLRVATAGQDALAFVFTAEKWR